MVGFKENGGGKKRYNYVKTTLGSRYEIKCYLCDLFPQVDDAEPVAEAREVLQLGAPLL